MDENLPKNKNSGEVSFSCAPEAGVGFSYEELLRTKKLYEEMQVIARFGTWEWDINSGKCLLSNGVRSIYGLDAASGQLDYDSFARFRHTDDRETVEQALRAAMKERKPYNIDYSIVRTDGEIRHVFEYGSSVYDNSGAPVKVFGSIKDNTENICMHDKLLESERLYRTLFENTEDAFVVAELIYDANGRVCDFKLVQFNDKFEKQTGVKPNDVAGRLAKEMRQDIAHHWIEMCQNVIQSGKAMHYQEHSKASNRWYDVFCFPYKQGLVSAIFRDITQYKNAEKALREANETSRLILDSINDGYGMFDRDGTVLNIGKKLAERFGRTIKESIGINIMDCLPEEKYGDLGRQRIELIRKVFDTGEPAEFPDTRDGLLFRNRYFPVFADGGVKAVSLFSTDITDSKKAWEEARKIEQLSFEAEIHKKKEQEYLELLDGTFEGTRIIDFREKRVEFSPKWAQRLGLTRLSPEELFNCANRFIHKDDLERVLCCRREGEENRADRFAHEYRILAGDSEYIWILDRGKVVYDEDGRVSKVYASSIDITESKKAQDKIKRQNTVLQAINRIYQRYVFYDTMGQLGCASLETINEATGSTLSFVTEMGNDGQMYEIAISSTGWKRTQMIIPEQNSAPRVFPVKGLYGYVLKSGKTLLTNDPASHPESTGIPEGHTKISSFLGVPFLRDGKVVGMVAVANREGGYSENEKEILEAITPTVCEVLLRKRAEEALRESEEKYRDLFNSIDEGFCIIEVLFDDNHLPIDFHFLEVNHAFERQTGLVDAAGRCMRDMVPDYEQRWFDTYGHIALTGESARFQNTAEALGRFYDVYAFRVGEPEQHRVALLFNDITERKKAEAQLTFQAQLLSTVHDAIVAVDENLDITYWNAMAEAISGWTAAEAKVLSGKEIFRRLGVDSLWPEFTSRLDAAGVFTGEVAALTKDGSQVFVDLHLKRIYGPSGQFRGTVSTFRDITERKQAEEAQRISEEHARTLVRQLEEADRNKNAFLSSLSHEIRNPLATISAGLQLMDISDDEAKIKAAKEIIDRQTDQLCSLVDELLDLTRITNNKIVLKKQRLELNELVSLIAKNHIPLACKKGLKLEVQLNSNDVYTDADPVRIRQIAGNLLQNAFKFTKAGGEIVLSVSEENGQAAICVTDSGIGIAPENLSRVFEPFIQIDEHIDRRGGGLGLGLCGALNLLDI